MKSQAEIEARLAEKRAELANTTIENDMFLRSALYTQIALLEWVLSDSEHQPHVSEDMKSGRVAI